MINRKKRSVVFQVIGLIFLLVFILAGVVSINFSDLFNEPFPAKTDMEMVLIPAGKFIMGADDSDRDQRPLHEVYLDTYWMDMTEVTNAQYRACVNDGGCMKPGGSEYYIDESLDDHPVIYISWFDARDFCAWAGKRLPTEAEWEKAARGMDGRRFPWGDSPAAESLANFDDNINKTMPVGSYPNGASPYGLLDLVGNVWEWTADWYDDNYYQTAPKKNPLGPEIGDRKVLRGGSWFSLVDIVLRANLRKKKPPEVRDYGTGFRCVFQAD
ncbi:MAG TPA: SUMF1/EgtB/PvdO family nonheme iron enzyme [Pelolinea sp.]|nr:SUMF1/EgtB/PvdO family nonheme iron enzyme [Pelolinea sp.]